MKLGRTPAESIWIKWVLLGVGIYVLLALLWYGSVEVFNMRSESQPSPIPLIIAAAASAAKAAVAEAYRKGCASITSSFS